MLVADNDTIVDATTGQILAIRNDETETTWLAKADAYEQDVMLQGDFFEEVCITLPVVIGNLIKEHITNANAMGRFAQ